MILQDARSVFDIDSYRPIVDAIHCFVHASDLPEPLIVDSERVIADYLKALYVLVADGAPPPGKNGRERIVKPLVRGIVTRQIILGIQSQEFLPTLVDRISQAVHSTVRALPEDKQRLVFYLSAESHRFAETVKRGHRQLEQFLKENDGRTLSGATNCLPGEEVGIATSSHYQDAAERG